MLGDFNKMDISIIDYKMSNLHSVQAACKYLGIDSEITSDHKKIMDSRIAILPGVGSFGNAMENLRSLGLDNTIKEFISTGKQFVGICLGLQLLFEKSEEFGSHSGLKIIDGDVKKFEINKLEPKKYKIPNIGWNKILHNKLDWENSFLKSIPDESFMYFVHSFYVAPKDSNIILSETNFGGENYCSSINFENIFATQFHPEKSGEIGLRVYSNMLNFIKSKE